MRRKDLNLFLVEVQVKLSFGILSSVNGILSTRKKYPSYKELKDFTESCEEKAVEKANRENCTPKVIYSRILNIFPVCGSYGFST